MVFKLQNRQDFVTGTSTYKVQRGITQKIYIYPRVMVLVICISSNVGKYFYDIPLRDPERFSSYRADGILFCSRHSQSLRGITQKIYIKELRFLQSAHHLMLVNISMTFHENILNGFQVTELQSGQHCIVLGIAKVQGGINQKIYIQELWFSQSAHSLTLVNISMMFHEDILNGFQVTELQSRRH